MTLVRGRIWDKRRGTPLEARVQVIASSGEFRAPDQALLKVGSGEPFFYAGAGGFDVEVPGGPTQVVVERGTEYTPLRLAFNAPWTGGIDVDAPLERWIDLPAQGWYGGNTHVHYSEVESRPVDRLRLDPRVEDLPVFVVSVLQRREIPYASNVFPIGRHALSTDHHVIDIGEESRHNMEPWRIGLGHIMLLNIRELVEPVSRGLLVDDASPDYPPLVDACDRARAQGGRVLWCHNGNGMEAPIAAALGRLDGLNLFDPYWIDPEYDVWYALLNCGIRLPASTGSDWFVCSSNRVYVSLAANQSFSYADWLAGLAAGRTLITNGPTLRLQVEQHTPSNDVLDVGSSLRSVAASIEWQWHAPIDVIELICDGVVAAAYSLAADEARGVWRTTIDADTGWVAARAFGQRRNSYGHTQWAHTSPVYLHARPHQDRVRAASTLFLERIETASAWLAQKARFDEASQRQRMIQLFDAGRSAYQALSSSSG
ncbi:MAG TPA: CehA/McbA family metallohydrolase [Chloroflexota bacterium]